MNSILENLKGTLIESVDLLSLAMAMSLLAFFSTSIIYLSKFRKKDKKKVNRVKIRIRGGRTMEVDIDEVKGIIQKVVRGDDSPI